MDFIERLFGISPDGGDGSFELLLIMLVLLSVAAFVFRRRLNRLFVTTDREKRIKPEH